MSCAPPPSVSISCVETRLHHKAATAVMRTLKACEHLSMECVYWFSNLEFPLIEELERRRGTDFLKWVKISDFSSDVSFNDQLSDITLNLISRTVRTDTNLIVQADGYAVNANAWTDNFFDYDYIGATWPWETEERRVGNGGFSLRSKKLYRALIDLRSRYSLTDLLPNPSTMLSQDKFVGLSIPEDNLIAKVYRPTLETEYGIRFAPSQLADQFSIETNANSHWIGKSFGFHGSFIGSFYIKSDQY